MRVISLVGLKGGSSKSTISLHLAVCAEQAGLSAAIIDTDFQGSAHKWFERRSGVTPGVIRETDLDKLPELVKRAEANGVDLLIIDTPGKAETTVLAACDLSDLVIIPTRPTQFDLETLGSVKRALRLSERLDRSYVLLSQCPTNSAKVADQSEEAIRLYQLSLIPVKIHTRADFSYAMTAGETATEFNPTGKAAQEAQALYQWDREEVKLPVVTREAVEA